MKLPLSGRVVISALLLFSVGAGGVAAAADKIEELPALKVRAETPLVKVAEYKMLEPRYSPALVARGNYIYIVSGLISENHPSKTVERFDIRTGKSEIVAEVRLPRMWHRAVLVGDKIYVLGGAAAIESLIALRKAALAESGIVVEYADGVHGLQATNAVEIVDLTTGKSTLGPSLPECRTQFACVLTGKEIVVMGGRTTKLGSLGIGSSLVPRKRGEDLVAAEMSATVRILDLEKQQWAAGAPVPGVPRTGEGVLVAGGTVVVTGGYDGKNARRDVAAYDTRSNAWREIAPRVRATSAHASVFLGQYVFLFGDYQNPGELMAYDLKTRQSEVFTLGYTKARHTAAIVGEDGRIYIIGGRADLDSSPLSLIQVFEPTKKVKATAPKKVGSTPAALEGAAEGKAAAK
jgi:hypothetical protein